jgi:hydrogenase maturation protease
VTGPQEKTLILGMGNPILSDDGVGLVVARALSERVTGITVETSPIIGMGLLDIMEGYDRIFVVDAMCTRDGTIGQVVKITEDGSNGTLHLFSSHGVHFFELMKMGRDCGLPMPEIGGVYGIEIGASVDFEEGISDRLKGMVDCICDTIMEDMARSGVPQITRSS